MRSGLSTAIMAVACSLLPTAALAQAMPVSVFLEKVDALKARGMAAMFSPDVGALKREIGNAATAYRNSAVSRAPHSCPPPKGKANITSDDLIAAFRTIPGPQRATTSVSTAFADVMVRRFPCR